jgi:uncharacterized heparinase superfamily protein
LLRLEAEAVRGGALSIAGTPLSLVPELLRALLRRALRSPRIWWRRTWFYRQALKGALADRIAIHPLDPLPPRLEEAEALLHGRFRFNGELVEIREGSIFDKRPPSNFWTEALHGFEWLPPLAAAGGEPARTLATNLISQWIKRHARYSEPGWLPQVSARRLVNVFAHGKIALSNSDMLWRSKVFVSLREQAAMLARTVDEAPDGMPRLEACAALALSGACLSDPDRLEAGRRRLEAELARQVLPDGGHVTRSPEQLACAYRLLTMVIDALSASSHPASQELRSAHDRMAPMLRFFRHGDGGLALFNGGQECDARMIAALLARDEVRGQPFAYAPHSGFQRMAAGRTLIVMDCGLPPKGPFSVDAHAGPLAFEMSVGQHRLVVNCGAARDRRRATWDGALRATAAHSTVGLADTSAGCILPPGLARDYLGPRLTLDETRIDTRRVETQLGWKVEASSDCYAKRFGVRHERRLTLGPHGTALEGMDRLLPTSDSRRDRIVPYSIRFHIHPEIRLSRSQGGDILLKLPNGEGWRFRASTAIAVEESVYLGAETLRRTEQLVLSGAVAKAPVEIGWRFEQVGRE